MNISMRGAEDKSRDWWAKGLYCVFQMVDEWNQISVGYPQLVVSVTGWVDTIKVDSWTMKPLHVIIVPFSHQDPGKMLLSDS